MVKSKGRLSHHEIEEEVVVVQDHQAHGWGLVLFSEISAAIKGKNVARGMEALPAYNSIRPLMDWSNVNSFKSVS